MMMVLMMMMMMMVLMTGKQVLLWSINSSSVAKDPTSNLRSSSLNASSPVRPETSLYTPLAFIPQKMMAVKMDRCYATVDRS